jgi:hypothetical protein
MVDTIGQKPVVLKFHRFSEIKNHKILDPDYKAGKNSRLDIKIDNDSHTCMRMDFIMHHIYAFTIWSCALVVLFHQHEGYIAHMSSCTIHFQASS